jgi:hypothetical protein
MQQHFTVVIKRHSDGYNYVPFDADVAEHHKAAMIGHLVATGHAVEPLPGGHVKLVSGPHAHKGEPHERT